MILNGVEEIKLENPGVLITSLPDKLFAELTSQINNISYNFNLISKLKSPNHGTGGIEKVFTFEMSKSLNEFMTEFAKAYCIKYEMIAEPKLSISWVNVMEKHEYNASHTHGDQGLTFVIWIKIPYNLLNEDHCVNNLYAKIKKNSKLEFTYSRLDGYIQTKLLSIDKSYEGKVVLFPSYLRHAVYPFYTSTEQRISLAGNFDLIQIL